MDQDRFDQIARLLAAGGTRRAGLRAALAAIGLLAGASAAADAKDNRRGKARKDGPAAGRKRKHECGPDAPCPAGYDCVKQGRKRRCSCPTGVICDGACCPTGQVCQNGACTVPTTCIAPGEPCKGVGKPCCDGRTCASGQGGEEDVACYVHKTGACQSTADCVYGTACLNGRCGFDVPAPAALGASCNPDIGQLCADPAAVCTPYTRAGAPSGSFCSLPLDSTCTGDPECTCYRCGYANGSLETAAEDRTASVEPEAPRLACCGPVGQACASDRNCCLGTTCVNGTCQSVCDVCANGCPYTTIKDAYFGMPAGSTIRIAPGTYAGNENRIETFSNTERSATLVRCGDEGTVTWLRPAAQNLWNGQYSSSPAGITVAFVDLEFSIERNAPSSREIFYVSTRASGVNRFSWLGCRFFGNGQREGQAVDMSTRNALTFADCLFENFEAADGGPAIYFNSDQPSVIDRCTFRNNVTTNFGGALFVNDVGPLRVANSLFENNRANQGGAINQTRGTLSLDDVTIRDNVAQDLGGALRTSNSNVTLTLSGSTTITGNRLTGDTSNPWITGSGAYCIQGGGRPCAEAISGTTDANVTGNTPADRTCAVRMPDNFYVVPCATWCLPAGAEVLSRDNDCALCCNGCLAGSGDPATCA